MSFDAMLAELGDAERTALQVSGITDPEGAYALAANFPGMHEAGVDIRRLSAAALPFLSRSSVAAIQSSTAAQLGRFPVALGARYPGAAPSPPGFRVPMPSPAQASSGPPGAGSSSSNQNIDLRIPNWAVRNQGPRGTCVAHALVACREYACANGGAAENLSEQFMFWAAKRRSSDPYPNDDGTTVAYAHEGLGKAGVCKASTWSYDPQVQPDVTHESAGVPTPPAQAEALGYAVQGSVAQGRRASANIKNLLNVSKVVAVAVPVFVDVLTGSSNWTVSPYGWTYGWVIDPPVTSVAKEGHAVCITGWEPDPSEKHGGYFVFRNSWGTGWGAQPRGGVPESGYGRISASYIDEYLWEACAL